MATKPTSWNYRAFKGMSRTKFDRLYNGREVTKLENGRVIPMSLDEAWDHIQEKLSEKETNKAEAKPAEKKASKSDKKASSEK